MTVNTVTDSLIAARKIVNAEAFAVLTEAVAKSVYMRAMLLTGSIAVEVESGDDGQVALDGDAGAFVRIMDKPDNAMGRPHYVLSVGFRTADNLWEVTVTDIEKVNAEYPSTRLWLNARLPTAGELVEIIDCRRFYELTMWEELDPYKFAFLAELERVSLLRDPDAEFGNPYLNADEVNMLSLDGTHSVKELRDWVMDLDARVGLDIHTLSRLMEELIATGQHLEDRYGSDIFHADDEETQEGEEASLHPLDDLMHGMLTTFCRDAGIPFDSAETLLGNGGADITERQRGWLECFHNIQMRAL